MTIQSTFDRSYFENRISRNRALAERSTNPSIRTIHQEYVRLYEQLLAWEDGAGQGYA